MTSPVKMEMNPISDNLQKKYNELPDVLKGRNGRQIIPYDPELNFLPWGQRLGMLWESPSDLGGGFEMFFKRKELKHQFVTLLTLPDRNKDFPFFIDHMDLYKFDPLLAHTLSEHHTVCTMVMSEAIINIQKNYLQLIVVRYEKGKNAIVQDADMPYLDPDTLSVKGELHFRAQVDNYSSGVSDDYTTTRIHPRVTNLHFRFHKEAISDIKATDVDKIMQITGVVTRAHTLKSLEYKRFLRCSKAKCKNCVSIMANFEVRWR
jgi:DNA replicative helicase MCM subunit Mcm2 (Cdc46/Mcm family)